MATFLLIHGAWHGAWCWSAVAELIEDAGHRAIAFDLPGHGAGGVVEKSLNPDIRSRLASLTMDNLVDAITAQIDAIDADESIVLVAHSMGGLPASVATDQRSGRLKAIIYVAAIVPPPGHTGLNYLQSQENDGEKVLRLLTADPQAVGAMRIDPRSDDQRYRSMLAEAFYNRSTSEQIRIAENALNNDAPAAPFVTPLRTHPQKWGVVPRHYVLCEDDQALRPAVQRRMIDDIDKASDRRTKVYSLDTDHSPFFSSPDALAHFLVNA